MNFNYIWDPVFDLHGIHRRKKNIGPVHTLNRGSEVAYEFRLMLQNVVSEQNTVCCLLHLWFQLPEQEILKTVF